MGNLAYAITSFETFNDSHTQAEVLAVVDRAIAISRGEA
jgi:hypothetical protein